ncbi:het domain-containing protein [Fusarium globosum]|uniref:Het domain-containing protein n=1 Tax=Fusarium globosum TaxID=78864 RepID=A0A8H6DEM2_9HYPO|nr:het domain-containing protein [Fusarium globosum]
MSSSSVYEALGQNTIRLLRLHNEASLNAISGKLITVKIENAPAYHALSYCWGAEEHNIPIEINGGIINVGPNLYAAVKRLNDLTIEERRMNDMEVKWLWIDRICINQDDPLERNRQVQLMGSIFSMAKRTLIWLGTDFDGCSDAWDLVDQVFNVFNDEYPNTRFLADLPFRMYSEERHVTYGLPALESTLWKQLHRLLQRPWFTRVWVIQEVVLSPQDPLIIHGHRVYPWYRLGWVASWLRRSGYLRLSRVPNQMLNVDMISNIRRSGTLWSLDALLVSTSVKTHATDQRDKVMTYPKEKLEALADHPTWQGVRTSGIGN